MEQDIKNLQQELLRLTQRAISTENKLSSYDTFFSDNIYKNSLKQVIEHGVEIQGLKSRISTLENARQEQKKLNSQFIIKGEPAAKSAPGSLFKRILKVNQ